MNRVLTKLQLIFLIGLFAALSIFLYLNFAPSKVYAASQPCYSSTSTRGSYSSSELSSCVYSGFSSDVQSEDAQTRNMLSDGRNTSPPLTRSCAGRSGSSLARCRINYSSPYNPINWISVRNNPTNTNFNVVGGQPVSLNLQTNQLRFLSSSLLNTVQTKSGKSNTSIWGSDYWRDIDWMYSSYPDDRAPYLSSPSVNAAAHRNLQYNFTRADVVSGPGTAFFPSSNPKSFGRYIQNSRYWFNQSEDLSYSNPTGFNTPGTHTVTIEVGYKGVLYVYGGYECYLNSSTRPKPTSYSDADQCPERTFRVSFTVNVSDPTWDVDTNVSRNESGGFSSCPSGSTLIPTNNRLKPGQSYCVEAWARNYTDNNTTDEDICLAVFTSRGSSAITKSGNWANSGCDGKSYQHGRDVGNIAPNSREYRRFAFTVRDDAPDDQLVCFYSRVEPASENRSPAERNSPDNNSSLSGRQTYCARVYRDFDMRANTPSINASDIEPGQTYTVSARIYNNSDERDTSGYPVRQDLYVSHNGDDITLVGQNDPTASPKNTSSQYQANANRWVWEYSDSFARNGNAGYETTVSGTFTVNSNADDGDIVCFRNRVRPRTKSNSNWRYAPSPSGGTKADRWCAEVRIPRGPFVTTSGNDVNAGAVVSTQLLGSACSYSSVGDVDVKGRVKNSFGSKSQYAVSATGRIIDFGSRNSTTDSRLKFGNTSPPPGRYSPICRPNYAALPVDQIVSSPVNLNALSNDQVSRTVSSARVNTGGINIINGKRVTLIVNGNATITENIQFNPSFSSKSDIPAVAIVALGDINIDPSVTRLDAYLVSMNGRINTCRGVGTNPNIETAAGTNTCANQLTVNGAMIGNQIHFRRTGGDVRTDVAAERIHFSPLIYLAPPPGFFGTARALLQPIYEGERPPVY